MVTSTPANTHKPRRVVITGLGVVSAIGTGWQEFWKNLIAGKSGISRIESFDTSAYDRHYGGEVKDFRPERFIDRRKLKFMGRASQLAVAAAKLALEDAGLRPADLPRERTGVCMGTTMGEPQIMEKMDARCVSQDKYAVDPYSAFGYPARSIANSIAFEFNFRGPDILFSTACASGNYSIGYSYDLIKSGRVDRMLAGGSEAFSRIAFAGFNRLLAMAPEKCQPFDKNRQGMMLGEGSGVLVIESLAGARARHAPIYAEILGYGLSCDAKHMTMPDEYGIFKSMRKAFRNSGVAVNEIDYINAHGTGTHQNDIAETSAIKLLFKASGVKPPPLSSIKSMIGHTMGSAAAIEAISCCLTIRDQIIPPTINYEAPDPVCNLDCVPNQSRKARLKLILNNSSAFGGNNACLVLRKVDK